MEQAVEERGDGRGVAEELPPVLDGAIRGEDRGGTLVASHDELEEVLGGGVGQLAHAEVVDALLLAGVGVYGIASHTAASRRFELGVRLALGATQRQLVALVLQQTLRPVILGATLGIGAALLAGRLLGSFLFEIGPTDSGALSAAALLLLSVALLAGYVPARRASRADPVVTLKSE